MVQTAGSQQEALKIIRVTGDSKLPLSVSEWCVCVCACLWVLCRSGDLSRPLSQWVLGQTPAWLQSRLESGQETGTSGTGGPTWTFAANLFYNLLKCLQLLVNWFWLCVYLVVVSFTGVVISEMDPGSSRPSTSHNFSFFFLKFNFPKVKPKTKPVERKSKPLVCSTNQILQLTAPPP